MTFALPLFALRSFFSESLVKSFPRVLGEFPASA
jgi:hypothetical protein